MSILGAPAAVLPSRRSLEAKVALVVGGGSGLGRSIARAFAREGATIAVADLNEAAARESLADAPGVAIRADVSDPGSSAAAVEETLGRFGRLDVLVDCAAICLVDPLLEVTPERWDKVFAINARGAFFCMQAAAKAMIPRGAGRILLISSPAARMGFPYFASYGASKAVVESLAKAAAVAWGPHGITVNLIVPGRMTGGMIDQLEADLARVQGKTLDELRAGRTQNLPMGRRVDPDEVAQAAVWLASDAAGYVTGERFNFTGGMELS